MQWLFELIVMSEQMRGICSLLWFQQLSDTLKEGTHCQPPSSSED